MLSSSRTAASTSCCSARSASASCARARATRARLYRVAEIEQLEDAFDPAARPRVIALRQRAIELVAELTGEPGSRPALTPGAFRDVDDVTFVNALSNAFPLPPAEKQSLLEAASIPERYERLVSTLALPGRRAQAPGSAAFRRDPLSESSVRKSSKNLDQRR